MVAGLLIVAGAAVPHFDDKSLSTLLFLAGTGLTAFLLKTPWPLAADSKAAQQASKPRTPRAAHLPARFSELIARQNHPALDRAWAKLTAHMSHELRTPLNAVLGFSELMSNEVFGPLGSSLYSSYARDIHASGRLLLKSAEDALAITSLLTADRKGSYPATHLRETVDDASAFAAQDLQARSIAVVIDIEPSIDVVGEPQAVRQALVNLLAEAGHKAEDGATITIAGWPDRESVRLSIEVSGDAASTAAESNGFHIMLARTLCELSGAKLTCSGVHEAGGRWTVDFLSVAQDDFLF